MMSRRKGCFIKLLWIASDLFKKQGGHFRIRFSLHVRPIALPPAPPSNLRTVPVIDLRPKLPAGSKYVREHPICKNSWNRRKPATMAARFKDPF
jgi:hypothetical protein